MKQWDVKSNISQPIVPQALGGLGITTSGSVLALLGRIVGDVHRLETYRTIIGDHRVSKVSATGVMSPLIWVNAVSMV